MFVKPTKSFLELNKKVNEELFSKKVIGKILLNLEKLFNMVKNEKKINLFLFEKLILTLYFIQYSKNDFFPLKNFFFQHWENLARYRYGNNIGNWLIEQIHLEMECGKYDFISNITFYEIGSKQEEDDFNSTTDCCGRANFIDSPLFSSRKFKFGFNYGH